MMNTRALILVLVLGMLLSACHEQDYGVVKGQTVTPLTFEGLPMTLPDADYKPLRSALDPVLERALEAKLTSNSKWRYMINERKMAVGVVDISDPYHVRYASVNGDEMMYAASLPKIAILLAAVDAFESGELEETEELVADLDNMIGHSSNTAATRFIDLLGYERIESVLTDPRYALYDEDFGGGLWVGKRYAAQGRRYPEPLEGLSHAATVTQVCRFYYMMAMGRLISPERSRQMLSLMDEPALHHKFVNTLDVVAPDAKLYRKSGTWRTYHSDSVLVWGSQGRRYILVALIDDPDGERIIRSLVRPVESVLRTSRP